MEATFCPHCETELIGDRCPACGYDAATEMVEPEPELAIPFSEKYRTLAFASAPMSRRRSMVRVTRSRIALVVAVLFVAALWASMVMMKDLPAFIRP